jgi:hypothetical protein
LEYVNENPDREGLLTTPEYYMKAILFGNLPTIPRYIYIIGYVYILEFAHIIRFGHITWSIRTTGCAHTAWCVHITGCAHTTKFAHTVTGPRVTVAL